MEVIIDSHKYEALDIRHIDGYRQVKYMCEWYGMPFWHCDCGEFGSHPCTPNFCKHTNQIQSPVPIGVPERPQENK